MKQKVICLLKKRSWFNWIFLCLVFGVSSPAFAAGGTSVVISGITDTATNIYTSILAKIYNKVIETYADLAYALDPQLPAIMASGIVQQNSHAAVAEQANTDMDNEINKAFSGIHTRDAAAYKMTTIPAGDDVISTKGISDSSSWFGSIFGGTSSEAVDDANKAALKNNAMFNIESLLGHSQYADENTLQSAQSFVNQISFFADPPPVIKLAPVFEVPFMDPNDPTKDSIVIGQDKPISISDLQALKTYLLTKPDYRSYRNSYRGMMAVRSIFLDNITRAYEDRVPYVYNSNDKSVKIDYANGQSAMAARNELVQQFASKQWYKQMATASPATVSRESLFLLAQINSQLNAIREQNERLLVVESVNGLNSLSVASQVLKTQAKAVGYLIYCKIYPDKDICQGGSGSSTAAALSKMSGSASQ